MDIKRTPMGIPNLDPLIGGGLKEGSVTLVAGAPGAGKTIFAFNFLVYGMEALKEPAIYITFEEKKQRIYEDMMQFGWDLEAYEKKGLFAFLEYSPEQVKKVLTEGGGIIESIIDKMKAKRLVIDSVTSFALLYKNELTRKEASLALIELINEWGCTALMTAQDTSTHEGSISADLEFEVDGIVILYHIRQKGRRKRALEILKMRGTKTPDTTFYFDITDQGISAHPQMIADF